MCLLMQWLWKIRIQVSYLQKACGFLKLTQGILDHLNLVNGHKIAFQSRPNLVTHVLFAAYPSLCKLKS